MPGAVFTLVIEFITALFCTSLIGLDLRSMFWILWLFAFIFFLCGIASIVFLIYNIKNIHIKPMRSRSIAGTIVSSFGITIGIAMAWILFITAMIISVPTK